VAKNGGSTHAGRKSICQGTGWIEVGPHARKRRTIRFVNRCGRAAILVMRPVHHGTYIGFPSTISPWRCKGASSR